MTGSNGAKLSDGKDLAEWSGVICFRTAESDGTTQSLTLTIRNTSIAFEEIFQQLRSMWNEDLVSGTCIIERTTPDGDTVSDYMEKGL